MSEQNLTANLYSNKDAFGEIVQKHQNLVLATAYSITGNLQQSEDLAQETFLAAWKQLGELREIEKLPAWLCGIARNLAHNWLRRTQIERQSRSDLPITEAAAETIAPETEAESEERIALLWATLKEIPMQFREPLVMYYQQNQSVANIAAALEISEDNVRQRIARGRTFLKKEVERQVEKTLLHIRPSEHFTVAVLAALPILATSKQLLAASSAGAAAAQSASSGGAGAGHTFIAGITTFFWTLFNFVLPVIVVGLGVVLGIWSGIRHAPTLRARQFMIKTALGWFIAACVFYLLLDLIFAGMHYAVGPDHHRIPERMLVYHFCHGVFWLSMVLCPIAVIASSYSFNRQWRRIVEEDLVNQDQISTPVNAIRSVYLLGSIALLSVLSIAFSVYALREWGGIPPFFWFVMTSILLFGISLFYCAIRISRNQQSFEKYPPRLPNLLSILTGEEKAQRGFRNRISFWGDIAGIGWGLYMLHIGFLGWYFKHRARAAQPLDLFGVPLGNGYALTITLVLIVYFVYALFFAGIPRKRYWGMIFIGSSVLLIDIGVIIAQTAVGYHVHGRIAMPFQLFWGEFLMIYGFSAWYLLCFTLLGAAGLRAFQKGNQKKSPLVTKEGK